MAGRKKAVPSQTDRRCFLSVFINFLKSGWLVMRTPQIQTSFPLGAMKIWKAAKGTSGVHFRPGVIL